MLLFQRVLVRLGALALLLSIGCIDPFEFKGVDNNNNLVVDGYITNVAKRHFITISRTSGFSNNANPRVSGCTVIIADGANQEVLQEIQEGVYATNPFFSAEEGRSYHLVIVTPEDERIISDSVQMVKAEVMEELEYRERTAKTIRYRDEELIDSYFIDFSINIMSTGSSNYYKWNFLPFYVFRANRARDTPREWCYVRDFEPRTVALFADSKLYKGGNIITVPIGTIPYSFKLEYDYRLMVEQLTLDPNAHRFWDTVRKQAENTGSVFDPLPATPVGNLTNETTPEKPVLGYFGAYRSDSLVVHLSQYDLEEFEPLVEFDCGGFQPRPGCFNCRDLARGKYREYGLPEWW